MTGLETQAATYRDHNGRIRCDAHEKVLYQQKSHADGAIQRHGDPAMEAYPCRRVKGWHIGHSSWSARGGSR